MTAILGISAFYHDSAAALLVDGELVAAAQEERFTRRKHDHRFPEAATQFCLERAGLTPDKLDYVGFYDKPLLKFERLLETYLAFAPRGFSSFLKAMPLWLREKLHVPRECRRRLPGYRRRIVFAEHHQSHAASAFYPSPFEEAAIITLDGVGEWATASVGQGAGNRIELNHQLAFPHSLGLLYSAFTYFCGFRVNSGEYKLMGLAPYGEPEYAERILRELIDLRPDGSFRLDLSYFNYCQGLTMTSRKLERLFHGPPRRPEAPLTARELNLAASIQQVTEEIMLRTARWVHSQTKLPNLCLAGGVALNCVGNGRILREGPFEHIWIQPAAGDSGGALGIAALIWHQLLHQSRRPRSPDGMGGALLGPEFTDAQVREALDAQQLVYHQLPDSRATAERVAGLLAEGNVVGWFQGRMEFGPRALGARSILADPRDPQMQAKLNRKIKFRESFRPFAPAVLADAAPRYFDLASESPYMLLVAPVASAVRVPVSQPAKGLEQLPQLRSQIPAVTHVDYSARVQTVSPQRHPRLAELLACFQARTGCPVLINTSFNVRGEPIVCTPADAIRCFLATEMDALAIENCLLLKAAQPAALRQPAESYVAGLPLD